MEAAGSDVMCRTPGRGGGGRIHSFFLPLRVGHLSRLVPARSVDGHWQLVLGKVSFTHL